MNEDKAINETTKFVQKYREKEQKFYDYLFSIKENNIPIEAIETILNLYKQKKEWTQEIIKAEKFYRELYNDVVKKTNERYIPKDKIREKIKEIENRIEKNYKDYDKSTSIDLKQAIHRRLNTNIQIRDVLKELLEEE